MKMKKEYKVLSFKVEEAQQTDDVGMIEGYAAAFGNTDAYMDVIDKGAFKRTIKQKKGHFPILLDHDPKQQVGWNLEAAEDDFGLRVKGEIQLITEAAKNRFALAKRALELKTKMGLSIGYVPVKIKWEDVKEGEKIVNRLRHLLEINLWEYSLVAFPANDKATVTGTKSEEILEVIELINRGEVTVDQIKKALANLDTSGQSLAEPVDDSLLKHSFDELRNVFRS